MRTFGSDAGFFFDDGSKDKRFVGGRKRQVLGAACPGFFEGTLHFVVHALQHVEVGRAPVELVGLRQEPAFGVALQAKQGGNFRIGLVVQGVFESGGLSEGFAQVFEGFAFDDGDAVYDNFAVGDVVDKRRQGGVFVNAVVARFDIGGLRVETGVERQYPVAATDDAPANEFAVERSQGITALDGDDAVAFGNERGIQGILMN